jgi:hypothetical protein
MTAPGISRLFCDPKKALALVDEAEESVRAHSKAIKLKLGLGSKWMDQRRWRRSRH